MIRLARLFENTKYPAQGTRGFLFTEEVGLPPRGACNPTKGTAPFDNRALEENGTHPSFAQSSHLHSSQAPRMVGPVVADHAVWNLADVGDSSGRGLEVVGIPRPVGRKECRPSQESWTLLGGDGGR